MAPRGRLNEALIVPRGNHPILVRYSDEKDFVIVQEVEDSDGAESDYDDDSDHYAGSYTMSVCSYSSERTALATPPLETLKASAAYFTGDLM